MLNTQQKVFSYGIRDIPYQITRKLRRSLKIEVDAMANVFVTAPEDMSDQSLEREVKRSGGAIYRRIVAAEETLNRYQQIINEEAILFQGSIVPLNKVDDNRRRRGWLTYQDNVFTTNASGERLRKLIVQFYKTKSAECVQERAARIAELMGIGPVEAKIKAQRKRWGSWAKSGIIYVNYLFSAFAPEVSDYILVHEMAHSRHHSHSKTFWDEVSQYVQNARKINKMLETDGMLLVHLYN